MRLRRKGVFAAFGLAAVCAAILLPTGVVGAQRPGPQVPRPAQGDVELRSPGGFERHDGERQLQQHALLRDRPGHRRAVLPAGHDEPAIDPISSVPGSGQDVTWTFKLPSSSANRSLLDMGPTFWVGATLHDPSSLANSVFSELQFYPDSTLLPQSGNDINTACTQFGFNVAPAKNTWSICDFSWGLYPSGGNFFETVACRGALSTGRRSRSRGRSATPTSTPTPASPNACRDSGTASRTTRRTRAGTRSSRSSPSRSRLA